MFTRQYEEIWHKLKNLPRDEAEKKGVSIVANKAHHRRIAKAVRKEKWMDLVFKLEIEPAHAILYHTRSGSILTFILVRYSGIGTHRQITVDDL